MLIFTIKDCTTHPLLGAEFWHCSHKRGDGRRYIKSIELVTYDVRLILARDFEGVCYDLEECFFYRFDDSDGLVDYSTMMLLIGGGE